MYTELIANLTKTTVLIFLCILLETDLAPSELEKPWMKIEICR